jgi:hypothetical protein
VVAVHTLPVHEPSGAIVNVVDAVASNEFPAVSNAWAV